MSVSRLSGKTRPESVTEWRSVLWPDPDHDRGTDRAARDVNDVRAGGMRYALESMVVLRCTQKLLVRLKQTDDRPPVESTTRVGDWYGNILGIGRRQMLLFICERSRLPVVIPIRHAKRLGTVFPDAVCEMLATVGVSAADIVEERSRMSDMAFGRTRNRSLLGTLNDFAFMAQAVDARRAEPESPEELMRFLARTPILALDGARPIDLTRRVFGME